MQLRTDCEQKLKEKDGTVCSLETEKVSLLAQIEEERQRAEDLQFKFEEVAITHGDANTNYLTRIKELEHKLQEEAKRVELLEQDSNKLFEAEEELAKTRVEVDELKEAYQKDKEQANNGM